MVKLKNKISNLLISVALPLLLLIIWELSVRFSLVPNTLIASPTQVLSSLVNLLLNLELLKHSSVSLLRLVIGFILGVSLGLALGIYVGVSKLGEKIFSPTIQLIAPIPAIAWIPLLIIIFGIGEGSKIALITLASFFVVYLNTIQGIRSTDQKLIELSTAYKKSDKDLIKKVLIPSALPNIFTGMRLALGLSWILLIAAEVIASSSGLGWLIWDSRNFSRPDDMIVGMITIGILGKLSDMLLISIEKRFTQWRRVFGGK